MSKVAQMLNIFGKERGVKRDGFTLGKFFVVIAVLGFLFALPERGSGMDQFKVVGYAPNWYGTGYLDRIDYSQVTHLIYAFAIPTEDGEVRPLNDGGFIRENRLNLPLPRRPTRTPNAGRWQTPC